MTIRAKLYTAIVLTVLGPLATTAVALQGMAELGERFDEVHLRAEAETVARELKFLVADVNGWQTAYGYDPSGFRERFVSEADDLRGELDLAADTFTDGRERSLLRTLDAELREFLELDRVAWRSLQAGNEQRTRRILLGPELARFESMASTADRLADYELARARATEAEFDDARDDARRRLIAVALGAGVVIVLLLVTANDIARMALEGERSAARRGWRERRDDAGS